MVITTITNAETFQLNYKILAMKIKSLQDLFTHFLLRQRFHVTFHDSKISVIKI